MWKWFFAKMFCEGSLEKMDGLYAEESPLCGPRPQTYPYSYGNESNDWFTLIYMLSSLCRGTATVPKFPLGWSFYSSIASNYFTPPRILYVFFSFLAFIREVIFTIFWQCWWRSLLGLTANALLGGGRNKKTRLQSIIKQLREHISFM